MGTRKERRRPPRARKWVARCAGVALVVLAMGAGVAAGRSIDAEQGGTPLERELAAGSAAGN